MLRIITIVMCLFNPLVAFAINGTFVMGGVSYNKYKKIDNKPYLQYSITAEKQTEVVDLTNRSMLIAVIFDEQKAKTRFRYDLGKLTVGTIVSINFTEAYYYNGEFVMLNIHGTLNGKRFSAPKMRFNEHIQTITAKRIMFEMDNKKNISHKFIFTL